MDAFDTIPETNGDRVGERSFDSATEARDWLERRGWREGRGCGYWRGPNGIASMFTARRETALKTIVNIESV